MKMPIKCPVCEGRGSVPENFYSNKPEPILISERELCRTCRGETVLWAVVSDPDWSKLIAPMRLGEVYGDPAVLPRQPQPWRPSTGDPIKPTAQIIDVTEG